MGQGHETYSGPILERLRRPEMCGNVPMRPIARPLSRAGAEESCPCAQ
jgi:hypothetical protein